MDVLSPVDHPNSPQDLSQAAIAGLPTSSFYVPNFITECEEQEILSKIFNTPSSRWTRLARRRLLSLPSALTGTSRDTLPAAPLPSYLTTAVIPRFARLGIFSESPHGSPNHVLINEYNAGQGIMPHEDGPAYHPVVATISLAAPLVLEIYEKNGKGEREAVPKWRILQEPRSLLITTGNMYRETLHGIAEVNIDEDLGPNAIANWELLGDVKPFQNGSHLRRTRISLTYRDVLKTSKLGGAMKFMNKR